MPHPARRCRLFVLLFVGVALAWSAASAQDSTLSPYFVVTSDDPETDRLPLLATHVRFSVSGVIAEVTLTQTYKNDGMHPIHAKYVFPASTRAAVHGLTMQIDEHRITAKIREREQAKKQFKAAKKAGKNAALLEQQRPNVFTMNVSNIMPGQEIDVELRYTELLIPTDGVYEFMTPTVVGPRYSEVPARGAASTDLWLQSPYSAEGIAPTYTFELSGTLNAGMPVDALVSPSHPIAARWESASTVHVELDPAESAGGNRDFVLRYRLDGGRIQSGLMLYEGEEESFFLLMVQPPRKVATDQIPPREYVFVVDVSGSMSGFPLDVSKELLRNLIGDLRESDTFNVLFFAGGSRLWSPYSLPATPANIESAIKMLNEQTGGGGTQLLAATRRAMELPVDEGSRSRNIIVITDGYIGAEKEVFRYIRANLNNANVFSFGVGSSVNRFLIEGIAKAGLGEPFVVLDQAEAEETSARFQSYIQFPVLTDIRVETSGFEAYDIEPSSIPDVLSGRPIVVHGKWRGEPGGRLSVEGFSGRGPYYQDFEVSEVEPTTSNSPLRYLWARTRIAGISDFSFAGETEEEREELIDLGLTYNLLTRHTSFIAVHELIRNPTGDAKDVVQPLPLPAGVGNLAVGVTKGSEPGMVWLVSMMLIAAMALALQRKIARS